LAELALHLDVELLMSDHHNDVNLAQCQREFRMQVNVLKNGLLKASTQALTSANLRSFDCAIPATVATVAKDDGVSTIIPDA
jgi:hypothetical protein